MNIFDVDGELKESVADVLYELGNVGVGTAIMTIGNIRNLEIKIGTPSVITMKSDIFSEIEYDPDQVMVGVATKMSDTLDGSILFMLSREFVRNTVYQMTDEHYSDQELLENEDSVSALQEMINYMTAGYAKVIGSYLGMPVYISSASVGIDKAQNIIQEVVQNAPGKIDRIACVNTRFTVIGENGTKTDEAGQVLIIPDEVSINKFIEIMGD